MVESMLTTIDNPYNPFVQWDEWWAFDVQMGYNTCGLLARLVITSDELSEEDQSADIDEAIDKILEMDPFGIYKRALKEDPS